MTTKTDLARYRKLQDYGCVCCRMLGYPGTPGDIHHLVDRGTREASGGNASSIALCPYHHRGAIPQGYTRWTALAAFGPSLSHGSKPFSSRWGSQRLLLAKVNAWIAGEVPIAAPEPSP